MNLATLFVDVDLDTTKFNTGVNNTLAESKSFAQKIGADADSIKNAFTNAFSFSVGQLIADGFKQALGEMWDFTKDSVQAAAAAEQVDEKLKTIFGEENARSIIEWSKTTKEQYGISAQAAKEYVANIAGLFGSDHLGFTVDELMEMSMTLVGLTGDLASFHNFTVPQTYEKILSGLRGETEAIEDLSIDLRANSIAPFFEIQPNDWGKLDQYTRNLLTYQYIMATTTKAQGDFARTSETYQNQLATFNASVQDLQATLGTQLLPVATSLLEFMNTLFSDTKSADEVVNELGGTFTSTYGDIAATTQNALALVTKLEQLEKEGVDTNAEFESWTTTLTELQSLIPSVTTLINAQTLEITGGTKALKDHVNAWKTDGIAMASVEVMQDYNSEIVQQTIATEKALRKYNDVHNQNLAYIQAEGLVLDKAEDYLMENYSSQYKTRTDLMYNQYGATTDRTSALMHQLYWKAGRDPTANALYNSLVDFEKRISETSDLEELEEYRSELNRLDELKAEEATIREILSDLMTTEEERRAEELEALNDRRAKLQENADIYIDEVNKAIDRDRAYDPERMMQAWEAIRSLDPKAAAALTEYINASGAAASAPGSPSWAVGELDLMLPKDFYQVSGNSITTNGWQAALEEFKASRRDFFTLPDFFSGHDYSRSLIPTFEDTTIVNVYLDGQEVGDIITERVETNMQHETSTKSKTGGSQ